MVYYPVALEILASLLGIAYIVLIAQKKISAWPVGILSCSIFAVVCFAEDLKSQGIIQVINLCMGVYAWIKWNKKVDAVKSIPLISLGSLLLFPLLYFISDVLFPSFSWTKHLDQIALIYSVVASYLTLRVIKENWHLWILINGITALSTGFNGLYFYSCLSFIYLGVSIYGIISWKTE